MKIKIYICLFSVFLLGFSSRTSKDIKPAKILHQMYDSIKNIKTLRVKVSGLERMDKKYNTSKSEYKVLTSPRKIYLNNTEKKIEILYNPELYGSKALVKPHTFPYLTISLDPTGSMMRKNQHYSINEVGYGYIGTAIALTISKDKNGMENFVYLGKTNKNGHICYLLEYENKNYAYMDYIVGDKETASGLASKLSVNDFLLRDKNGLVNDFGYIKKGTVLKVPTLYCKKAILFVDEKLFLPISIALFDDAGLFESYDYANIIINKPFKDDDFKRENKDYNF
ncbi:MAG: DUF1571 domain-containing protein [Bacteroidia bacterium]